MNCSHNLTDANEQTADGNGGCCTVSHRTPTTIVHSISNFTVLETRSQTAAVRNEKEQKGLVRITVL